MAKNNRLQPNSFFSPGETTDSWYMNVRDGNHQIEKDAKAFVEWLWAEYQQICPDQHILSSAKNQFQHHFWEMYLGVTLKDRGFPLEKTSGKGPDFRFKLNNQDIWIEAIAATPGTTDDAVPELKADGKARNVPGEQIVLRLVNALETKANKRLIDIEKGCIGERDPYIIAINAALVPNARLGDTLPYIVKAVFPIGHMVVTFDLDTMSATDTRYQYRDAIKRQTTNAALVSTNGFLNERYNGVSGVLYSCIDSCCHANDAYLANIPTVLGRDFIYIPNPNSVNPISNEVFSFCTQYIVNGEGQLVTIEPQ